jgi:hypothetical protein
MSKIKLQVSIRLNVNNLFSKIHEISESLLCIVKNKAISINLWIKIWYYSQLDSWIMTWVYYSTRYCEDEKMFWEWNLILERWIMVITSCSLILKSSLVLLYSIAFQEEFILWELNNFIKLTWMKIHILGDSTRFWSS